MQLQQQNLKIGKDTIACEFAIRHTNAVIVHGAGTMGKERYQAIAQELLKHDVGVVMFDFAGHGASSGVLKEQSLLKRKELTERVITELIPSDSQLYLLGFSMGAQTVCDLLPVYDKRVEAILLGCPAMYAEEAYDMLFGNPEFTRKLREDKSWEQSLAPSELKTFTGHTVIAIGAEDEVIPKGVVKLLREAAQHPTYVEFPEVTHKLIEWLAEHPKDLSELISELFERDSTLSRWSNDRV